MIYSQALFHFTCFRKCCNEKNRVLVTCVPTDEYCGFRENKKPAYSTTICRSSILVLFHFLFTTASIVHNSTGLSLPYHQSFWNKHTFFLHDFSTQPLKNMLNLKDVVKSVSNVNCLNQELIREYIQSQHLNCSKHTKQELTNFIFLLISRMHSSKI